MSFNPVRGFLFLVVGLPIGFILTALVFASTSQAIVAPAIAPWALGVAIVSGLVGMLWAPK